MSDLLTVFNPPEFKVGKGVVVVDVEIATPVEDPKLFDTPHVFPLSVACTYDDGAGFRDFVGEGTVYKLIEHLLRFDRVVGFNHCRFDCGVIDGSVMREFQRGEGAAANIRRSVGAFWDMGVRDPEPGMIRSMLRNKLVDLNQDVSDFLRERNMNVKGRRATLDTISRGMYGEEGGKLSTRFAGGKEAPKAWRNRMCLEVIAYCRMDVWQTANLYVDLVAGKPLRNWNWPKSEEINEFEGRVAIKLR